MGIFNVFDLVNIVEENLSQAESLAAQKNIRAAVKICEEILTEWDKSKSWLEKLTKKIMGGKILAKVKLKYAEWGDIIKEVDKLTAQGQKLSQNDSGNPLEIDIYEQVINLLKRCINLINDPLLNQEIADYEREIAKRKQFQQLLKIAELKSKQLCYKEALISYYQAYKLYAIDTLKQTILNCQNQSKLETIYHAKIQEVNQAIAAGKISMAIAILETAIANFPRPDGRELLAKLKNQLQAKQIFRLGLKSEQAKDYLLAREKYIQAIQLLPEVIEYRMRLSMVEIKIGNWQQAIIVLTGINHQKASYIRGFAQAKQGNWYEAYQEWQSLNHPQIAQQREILKLLVHRDRLQALKQIENFVETGKLPQAETASLAFIQKFKASDLVKTNLNQHIIPRLEVANWHSYEWEKITTETEKVWQEKQDIQALHNWSIASYYYYQKTKEKLEDVIIAWTTAIANIHIDPILKDVPWLGNTEINLEEITVNLNQLIEKAIDEVKERNLEEYFRLRDRYRLEITAIKLMGKPPNSGMKIGELFLTPGCYNKYKNIFNHGIMWQATLLQKALYTDWGLAVAACMEGDRARGILIKPNHVVNADVENYAYKFICYHEGCHYLQQHEWKKAVHCLRESQLEIKASVTWQEELDKLCIAQKRVINEFDEHLQFGQFWYEILGSKEAKSYLAEYKAEAIREKLISDGIDTQNAWIELKIIQQIDGTNPVVNDLIERLELAQEMQEIHQLLENNEFEEAVAKAKRSRYSQVRQKVAEICLDILVEGFKNRKLGFDHICELGKWAYELCPDDESVKQIYEFTSELSEIHTLMQNDQFDLAVMRAKSSENEQIKYYVAEFFFSTLIKGLESREMPIDLIQQLARWAYEICPNESQFKDFYDTLRLNSE